MWNAILGVGSAVGMALALFFAHGAGEKSGKASIETLWAAERASDAEGRVVRLEAATKRALDAGAAFEVKATNIRTTYRLIEKETSHAITPEIDARYPLPWAYVRLLDAATEGRVPAPPADGEPDGEPSPLSLTAAVSTGVGNAETCSTIREQVIGLQALIRAQEGY